MEEEEKLTRLLYKAIRPLIPKSDINVIRKNYNPLSLINTAKFLNKVLAYVIQ